MTFPVPSDYPAHPLRASLAPLMNPRIARLPIDPRGYPIPWFVAWQNGEPDFRLVRPNQMMKALREHVCWVCGERLRKRLAFVAGPMCGVNRISAEPPMHLECAEFSARGCPFLTMPKAERRDAKLPDGVIPPAGIMLKRNPGVAMVWITKSFTIVPVDNGHLIEMGPPIHVHWWAEGRKATREEVNASIASGLPKLLELAALEVDADAAQQEVLNSLFRLKQWLPAKPFIVNVDEMPR
jgi:hypothetical protein